MKRIAIVWPGFAGYTAACYQALAARCELRIFLEASVHEQQFDGAALQGLDWTRVEGAAARAEAVRAIRTWQPDLVLSCGWRTPLCRAVGKAPFPGARKVLAMDMLWERTLRKFAARFVLAPFLRRFDGIFVPGRQAARYARWLGFKDRIMAGMNAGGWERFGIDESIPNPRRFLFVGRFVPEKGLDILLKAYRTYRMSTPEPWPLDLVGCGAALPSEWPAGVRVLGFVRPDAMPQVMREHACLVLPSRWEPWGVCVAEAMSAGRATIVSDVCGIAKDVAPTAVVKSGDVAGFADAMRRVAALSDEDLAGLGRASRAAVARYSSARWADRVLALADGCFQAEVAE